MVGDDTLQNLSQDPELTLYSFSWGVAIFTVFTFVALIFVTVNAVIERSQNPSSKSLWWQYMLMIILFFLDVYCMVQCKLEMIQLSREKAIISVIRKGLNCKKNFRIQVPMNEVVEMHLQETRKKVGDTAHDYSRKYKLCLQLSNGDVLVTLTTHDQIKASNDLRSILRFIESCKQTSQHPQAVTGPPRRLETGATASTLDINVIDHTRGNMDDLSSYCNSRNASDLTSRHPSDLTGPSSSQDDEDPISPILKTGNPYFGKNNNMFGDEEAEEKCQIHQSSSLSSSKDIL